MALVAGPECVTEVQRRNADQQVGKGDDDPCLSRVGVNLGRGLSHLPGKRLNRNRRENRVEIIPALLGQLRGAGTMKPMLQFDALMDDNTISVSPNSSASLVSNRLTGRAARSAAMSTPESRTNPMTVDAAALGAPR
jgi:hypothetical protein